MADDKPKSDIDKTVLDIALLLYFMPLTGAQTPTYDTEAGRRRNILGRANSTVYGYTLAASTVAAEDFDAAIEARLKEIEEDAESVDADGNKVIQMVTKAGQLTVAGNRRLDAIGEELQEKWNAFESLVQTADGIRAEVAADLQAYADERSEAWQEGDAGSAYADWISAWEDEFDAADFASDFGYGGNKFLDLPREPG